MENPIKMDDLGVPLFSETSISHGVDFSLQLVPVDFYSVFELFDSASCWQKPGCLSRNPQAGNCFSPCGNHEEMFCSSL